jgi:putative endonuclease
MPDLIRHPPSFCGPLISSDGAQSRRVHPGKWIPRTLYIGVTSDLIGRIWQHRTGALGGFTQKYGIKRLVWFEMYGDMEHAIAREKQLKNWAREWKIELIVEATPPGATSPRISDLSRC